MTTATPVNPVPVPVATLATPMSAVSLGRPLAALEQHRPMLSSKCEQVPCHPGHALHLLLVMWMLQAAEIHESRMIVIAVLRECADVSAPMLEDAANAPEEATTDAAGNRRCTISCQQVHAPATAPTSVRAMVYCK
jgi:hypothetical protein